MPWGADNKGMSEWYTCPECGWSRENLCACINPLCPDYVALAKPKPDHNDIKPGKYEPRITKPGGLVTNPENET